MVHLTQARTEEVIAARSHELAEYPGILERLGLAGVHLGAVREQREDSGLGAVRVSNDEDLEVPLPQPGSQRLQLRAVCGNRMFGCVFQHHDQLSFPGAR